MRFSYSVVLVALASVALGACAEGSSDGGDTTSRDLGGVVDTGIPVDDDGGPEDGGPIDGGPECTIDAECNDGIGCTVDTCDPVDGCINLVDDTACDDGMICNGAETCDGSGATPGMGCLDGTPVDCDDGDACTTDICEEPAGTCMHAGSDADMDGVAAVGCGTGTDCDDTNDAIYPGAEEVCNAVDDDCDGTPDDGFTCEQGSTASCTTACGSGGTLTCNAACDGFGACVGIEVCNGCDDDGTGGPDDTFPCEQGSTESCMTSCGTPGTHTCNDSCTGYGSCFGSEVCGNGCDDDGDGMTDEDCTMPPPNDTCAGAIALTAASGSRSDAIDMATATVTGCGTGGEIWYAITLAVPSVLYVDTMGSAFDTRLSVRTGCGGSMLQCEDDHCGTLQEQLLRALPAGTHHIAVHAHSGAPTGAVNLRWESIPQVGGDHVRITSNGTYAGSTSGSGTYSSTCGGSGPEDMFFFALCPSTTRTVSANLCAGTSFDTVLSIVSRTGERSCNDDSCGLQSSTSTTLNGPGVFGIVVDGYGGDFGSYSVAVSGL
ncbi:MAG: putative metal-binding motif-containing protein [Deltaproteobacteria bacterium]|nr:putative metal-binding motif-containing protein [Deltaproteobacteria bacterium]